MWLRSRFYSPIRLISDFEVKSTPHVVNFRSLVPMCTHAESISFANHNAVLFSIVSPVEKWLLLIFTPEKSK